MMMTRPNISERTQLPEQLARSLAPDELFARYRYVTGKSGRRYLFTAVDQSEAADYADAVTMVLDEDRTELLWMSAQCCGNAGSADDVAGTRRAWPLQRVLQRSGAVFVHLLASDREDRLRVVEDIARTFDG